LQATDSVASFIISLPLYSGMTDRDADDVIEAVNIGIGAQKQAGAMLAG
jgi:dTDP-4-amino-4,6-dideoxygalactose transaminase